MFNRKIKSIKKFILKKMVEQYKLTNNLYAEPIIFNSLNAGPGGDVRNASIAFHELQAEGLIIAEFSSNDECHFAKLTQKGIEYFAEKSKFWKEFILTNITAIVVSVITSYLTTLITK